jgi:hypothetical protein
MKFKTAMKIKLIFGMLSYFVFICTYSFAEPPKAIRIGVKIKNWQARAAAETQQGFLVTGQETSTGNQGCMIVVGTDSVCNAKWTKTYGTGAGCGIEVISNQHALVSGSQNGIAKLWKINTARSGRVDWQIRLDSGLVRSVKKAPDKQLIVTIEHGRQLKVKRLDESGKTIWEQNLRNEGKQKSNLLVSREGYVVIAFGGEGMAMDSCGKIFWKHRNEATSWNGLYQRKNGEIVFYGKQKMKMFGPVNDQAFVMSVRPLTYDFKWFRSFGRDETFDAGYAISERPDEQLLLVASQQQRLRLIDLRQNYTMGKVCWLTDSLSTHRYQCVALLKQSVGQDKWLVLYNRSDGSVWLRPTMSNILPDAQNGRIPIVLEINKK